MASLAFNLRAWAAWRLDRQDEGSWYSGGPDGRGGTTVPPDPAPASLRRRIGPVGQNALRAAWNLPAARDGRIILASRNGEFDRTLSILDSLVEQDPVSPADFTLSVHHALAGLLAIAQSNHRGHTALAAGPDSFGFGLMEAALCLAEAPSEPAVLLYFDAPLPPPYASLDEGGGSAIAIALSIGATGPGPAFSLAARPVPRAAPGRPGIAHAFLDFLIGDGLETRYRGARHEWIWRRDVVAV